MPLFDVGGMKIMAYTASKHQCKRGIYKCLLAAFYQSRIVSCAPTKPSLGFLPDYRVNPAHDFLSVVNEKPFVVAWELVALWRGDFGETIGG